MTASQLDHLRALDPEVQRIVLAIGIVMDRLSRLSKDESAVVLGLFQDYMNAESDEDRAAADAAIMELLEQRPVRVERLNLSHPTDDADGHLQRWKDWVSQRIRAIRSEKGLTQEQLAERSGLPQSHISRIETAKHSPSRATLERIAAALEVPAATFDPNG